MKLRSILLITGAALFAASCSTTLQQRRVADELYQNPDQQVQQEDYMTYYDEAENILKEGSTQSVDSVIYEEKAKSYRNPYADILVDDYETARQLRSEARRDLSYGMSDWYGFYFSDAYHYASAYDPSFYNVIVMGDHVWVEPNWLTSHFGIGYRYGSFYNYPYNPFSYSPYSSSLSMTSIFGFNTPGYRGFSPYNFGYGSFGYSPFGYSPFGYSSFGYSSYYGLSPYMGGYYNNYYNSYDYQRLLQEEYKLNDEGRVAKYERHSNRYRKSSDDGKAAKAAAFIRTQDNRNDSRSSRTLRDNNTERYRTGTSQYVRSRKSSTSLSKPRYNRPNREANYERIRNERSMGYGSDNSGRKRNSVYRTNGSSSNRSAGSSSSGSIRKSSGSSGSSSTSSSSGSSGRKRK